MQYHTRSLKDIRMNNFLMRATMLFMAYIIFIHSINTYRIISYIPENYFTNAFSVNTVSIPVSASPLDRHTVAEFTPNMATRPNAVRPKNIVCAEELINQFVLEPEVIQNSLVNSISISKELEDFTKTKTINLTALEEGTEIENKVTISSRTDIPELTATEIDVQDITAEELPQAEFVAEMELAEAETETSEVSTIPEFYEYNYKEATEDWASEWNFFKGETLTPTLGRIVGPSGVETYYNLPMEGVLNIMRNNGFDFEYWVREDGVKMFGDYIMVAADLSIRPRGSIVKTTLGLGMVCDTGTFIEEDSYQLDIAVTW